MTNLQGIRLHYARLVTANGGVNSENEKHYKCLRLCLSRKFSRSRPLENSHQAELCSNTV